MEVAEEANRRLPRRRHPRPHRRRLLRLCRPLHPPVDGYMVTRNINILWGMAVVDQGRDKF